METFKGRAHIPGVEQEWLFVLEMNWEGKEVNLHVEGAPGHITSWQGLQVQTFGTYEIAFKTKGIPPLLTHWWHLVKPDNDNLAGLMVGLPDKRGAWTTCPINLIKVKS